MVVRLTAPPRDLPADSGEDILNVGESSSSELEHPRMDV